MISESCSLRVFFSSTEMYQITILTFLNPIKQIEFAKFGVETVLMAKTCNFDSNISDFNSVDLEKAQKVTKGLI